MNNRTLITLLAALVLIGLVMCVAILISYNGWVAPQRYSYRQEWSVDYTNTQSMKIIDLTGDGQDDLFVQNPGNLSLLDASGKVLASFDLPSPLVTSMGDINGDGVEDVVAFTTQGGTGTVRVISNGQETQVFTLDGLGQAARVAILRFPEGSQIILGDMAGLLIGMGVDGTERWRYTLGAAGEVRGLDDVVVGGQTFLAAANRNGRVALLGAQGQAVWTYDLPGGIRRLRAYDLNGDGNGEVLLGGENGGLVVLDAASGSEKLNHPVGQAVSEIREAEVDGDPGSREFVAGGKDGGVWAFTLDGRQLWAKNVSEKVTEISAVDLNDDGAYEVIIGDEGGDVGLYSGAQGAYFPLLTSGSLINRIDVGRLGEGRQMVVADGSQVRRVTLEHSTAPVLRFTPLVAGLAISFAILVVAWLIATNPPKPALRVAIEDQRPEGLQAQRRMLKESIADVERLRSAGEMTSDAYLARLKELRGQLAGNEAALKRLGVSLVAETFTCPHCGGTLPIGLDRCDYCGQTVLT